MNTLGLTGLVSAAFASVMGFYLSSYMVADQREAIDDMNYEIAVDEDAINRLEAELGVRASLARLERINSQVWALQAPRPGQIVGGGLQFAALVGGPADVQLQQASLELPAERSAVAVAEKLATLEENDERIDAPIAPAPRPAAPKVQVASMTAPAPASAPTATRAAQPTPAGDLLSDDFLAEIEVAATLERAGFQKVALR